MKTHRILAIAAVLLAISALASFAAPISQVQASGATLVVAQAAVPSLDAFLSSLSSAATPVHQAASSCGPNFCSQAERDACTQQCLNHHHGPFVGLECCSDSCTTLCICGSVPVGC
jgi:hypothetical protein